MGRVILGAQREPTTRQRLLGQDRPPQMKCSVAHGQATKSCGLCCSSKSYGDQGDGREVLTLLPGNAFIHFTQTRFIFSTISPLDPTKQESFSYISWQDLVPQVIVFEGRGGAGKPKRI